MVGTLEVYLPELDKTVWVNCSDEGANITSADCFWDQDGSGSWERYEDVLLLSTDFLNGPPDTLPEWAPMIREAQSFYTQQEVLHYTQLGIQERTNWTGEMNFK